MQEMVIDGIGHDAANRPDELATVDALSVSIEHLVEIARQGGASDFELRNTIQV